MSIERPALYVVATPLGNLADITLRALTVLRGVDQILCEDTRHSSGLLEHYGITTALTACHEHNEARITATTVAQLKSGNLACALISDAGTPLISDPGYVLVQAVSAAGIPIYAVPGASAATGALSISGLATDRFAFEGFLPARSGHRDARLQVVRDDPRTLVFYEAPHRLHRTLAAMAAVFGGERNAVVVREMTKRFESVYRDTLANLCIRLVDDPNAARGELVVIVQGADTSADTAAIDRTLDTVLAFTDQKTAVGLVAALTGAGRNAVYRRALARERDD